MYTKALGRFLGKNGITIKEAMHSINNNTKGILFLTDERGRLSACVSDGDIRRFLLTGGSIKDEVTRAATLKPIYSRSFAEAGELYRKYRVMIPVLDDEDVIVAVRIERRRGRVGGDGPNRPRVLLVVRQSDVAGTRRQLCQVHRCGIGDGDIIVSLLDVVALHDVRFPVVREGVGRSRLHLQPYFVVTEHLEREAVAVGIRHVEAAGRILVLDDSRLADVGCDADSRRLAVLPGDVDGVGTRSPQSFHLALLPRAGRQGRQQFQLPLMTLQEHLCHSRGHPEVAVDLERRMCIPKVLVDASALRPVVICYGGQ